MLQYIHILNLATNPILNKRWKQLLKSDSWDSKGRNLNENRHVKIRSQMSSNFRGNGPCSWGRFYRCRKASLERAKQVRLLTATVSKSKGAAHHDKLAPESKQSWLRKWWGRRISGPLSLNCSKIEYCKRETNQVFPLLHDAAVKEGG